MKIKNILLGSDPELFLLNPTKQVDTPRYIVCGEKSMPFPLTEPGYFIQRDNMAMEFCVPPQRSPIEFVKAIDKGIFLSLETLPEGFDVLAKPSLIFPKELIEGDDEALAFGCDPDFNAYTGKENPKPKASNEYLRSCGGR